MTIAVIIGLVSLASAMHLTDGACPTGWVSVGSRCYHYSTSATPQSDLKTYSQVVSSCDSIGGQIVVFDSTDEMDALGSAMADVQSYYSFFWIGCTDQAVEGTFMCEDGTQLALDSALWRSGIGQPSSAGSGGGDNDCVLYVPNNNGFEDRPCNYGHSRLCEVESTQDPTTATPRQTTAKDPTTQTPQQTTAQDPTTPTPQQTTAQDPTTPTPQQTTAQDPTTATPQQTTAKDPTTATPQQTTAQDPTTATPQQTTAQNPTTATPQKTTTNDPTTPTPQQTTTQNPTTQTPQKTTTNDPPTQTKAQAVNQVSTKSRVFSLAKGNEGRNLIGYCLTDHVMETVQMESLIRCSMMCNGIAGCKSFNYKGGVCELNDERKESVGSRYFVRSDGCTYYELA